MEAKLERAKADLKLLKRAVREREERATQAEAALKEGEATLAAAREELAQAASDRKLLRRHARQLEEALAAAREAIRAFRACPGADVPPRQPTQWAGAEEAQPLFLAREMQSLRQALGRGTLTSSLAAVTQGAHRPPRAP